jgi:hypothetical protein
MVATKLEDPKDKLRIRSAAIVLDDFNGRVTVGEEDGRDGRAEGLSDTF